MDGRFKDRLESDAELMPVDSMNYDDIKNYTIVQRQQSSPINN